MKRLAFLGGDVHFSVRGDGVRDYTTRLAMALAQTGHVAVETFWRHRDGSWSHWAARPAATHGDLWRTLAACDAVVLQYDMFRFDRRGFTPWLPLRLARLRRAAPALKLAVMVHELHLPFHGLRWQAKAGWQRVQHAGLRLSADVLFTPVEAWAAELAVRWPQRPAVQLPVGSNLPDRRCGRAAGRARLGVAADTFVLATFGADASAWRRLDYVAQAANAIARSGRRVLLLNLGSDTPPIDGGDAVIQTCRPGFLPAAELAELLAAADLFLAPFSDGVSTRRTTLMAALQHALPVVGTDGPYTDRVLHEARQALRLTPVADHETFARAALCLANDPDERRALGAAGRALYLQRFDWKVSAGRLLAALDLDAAPAAPFARAPGR